jgi:ankyrin repeat protein
VVQVLLKGVLAAGLDVNSKGKLGASALHLAAMAGHQGLVEVLVTAGVAAGVDVNSRGGERGHCPALRSNTGAPGHS